MSEQYGPVTKWQDHCSKLLQLAIESERLRDRQERERSAPKRERKPREPLPPRVNRNNALRQYGLDLQAYEDMVAAQGGSCAICKHSPRHGERALAVDHCHETVRVRGLLCSRCNLGIGHFRDSAVLLGAAIEYLGRR